MNIGGGCRKGKEVGRVATDEEEFKVVTDGEEDYIGEKDDEEEMGDDMVQALIPSQENRLGKNNNVL